MRNPPSRRWQISELFIALVVVGILVVYTYGILYAAPYPGFVYRIENGRIVEIYSRQTPSLQIGDVLVRIGPITWESYKKDGRLVFFEGVEPGETVDIVIERDGAPMTIPWRFTGFERSEFNSRFFNIWGLAFVFWIFGLWAQTVIRPKDGRRRLFIAANYLTALWLIFGSLSSFHLCWSSILLRVFTWLLLPVYLHLHWVFPRPLKELSRRTWILIYLASFVLAAAEITQALPKSLYAFGILAALLGSIVLEAMHYARQADQRRDVMRLAIATLVAFVPVIGLGILVILGEVPILAPLVLFSLPFLPLMYFYVIYRRQSGGLEVRLNRAVSLYAFMILFGTVLLVLVPFINLETSAETTAFIGALVLLAVAFFSISVYPRFQTFVETRFLGIRLPRQNLQETYSSRIADCASINDLLRLLENDLFPSLFIRQYAFVQVSDGRMETPLVKNVPAETLPIEIGISQLVERSGKFIPGLSPADGWIRLILPLKAGDSFIGFWLLGQRDPDDFYPQAEIPILQAIVSQTAIALSNMLHSEQLRKLYQSNVERSEQERASLAGDLHDIILHQLRDLRNDLGEAVTPAFQAGYEELARLLREIISDLRPPLLADGLLYAVTGLADNLMERSGDRIRIKVDIHSGEERLPQNIELHLYRIVQEACENSLRHAEAKSVSIHGALTSQNADLTIHDDGKGFDVDSKSKLDSLLANRHFGLSTMLERAALIGAEIKFHSVPNAGTQIRLSWGTPP